MAWYAKLSLVLEATGFRSNNEGSSLFVRNGKSRRLVVLIYVDDLIITGDCSDEITALKCALHKKFAIKDLGRLKYFLGIEMVYSQKGLFLNQRKYIVDLLKDAEMLDCKPTNSPISSKFKLVDDANNVLDDISYYQRLGWKCSCRKNTTGYCVFVGGNMVSWKSKKQIVVTRSSVEAEYRPWLQPPCSSKGFAASSAVEEVLRKTKPSRMISGLLSFIAHAITVFLIPCITRIDLLGKDIPVVALSSVVYLVMDPLFLYAPLINGATKCLVLDNKVKIAALVLRSWGDIRYLLNIFNIYDNIKHRQWRWKSPNKKMLELAGEMLAVLPIPQVAILVFLPNMRGSNSLKIMKFLNFLILLQYLPRVYPLYLLCKNWNTWNIGGKGLKLPNWSLIVVNMYGYLIASHILGAFWYFFSIQRQIGCWEHACRSQNGCEFSTSCVQNAHKNFTLLENLCPINPPDKRVFDFGIFQGALQSSMQGSTNFFQRWLLCSSWGIRNLSSYASNLTEASAYGWENLFVILISISGLVLFMYLLGFVQEFMKKVDKLETIAQTMEINDRKIPDILSEYGLSSTWRRHFRLAVKGKLREDETYIVENMFSILSLTQLRPSAPKIKRSLFLDKLKKIDGLQDKGDEVLTKICKQLEPAIYREDSYIIREGEPLAMMFFVTRGNVLTYATNNGGSNGSSRTIQIEKDNGLYGEELLTWAERPSCKFSNLPISDLTVKCHNKLNEVVEIFALHATDLQLIVSKFPGQFNMDRTLTIAVDNGNVN
ncbi:cyclic nucleotide-gated ion channel 1-like [Argentina anserina]|uniref:cyclic nucleotide-gated ion channel 1-like n=1 Tax=Argentina anserina TaxID=57926 RepID=UPI0021762455|nr:cyclic nucleotide-gated ion channel 1-like [Potentilla anserina]